MEHQIRSHRRPPGRRRPLVAAAVAALALVLAGAASLSTGTASADGMLSPLELAQAAKANCQLLAANATTSAQRTRANQCVTDQQRIIDLLLATPSPTVSSSGSPTATPPAPSPTPTTTTTTTPSPSPTTTEPSPTPTPTPTSTGTPGPLTCPAFPAFPDATCTGWRHTGVTLHECVADGHLDVPNATYDSCHFPSGVVIQAANIVITRSYVEGPVRLHWTMGGDYQNVVLVDVEIGGAWTDVSSVGNGANFHCLRCDIHGNDSGVHLGTNGTLVDSWSHAFLNTGAHGAAVGLGEGSGSGSVIVHNRLECYRVTATGAFDPTGGCSSAASLYDSLDSVVFKNNYMDSVSGFCLYAAGPNGTHISIVGNVFGNRFAPDCGGAYGFFTAWNPDPSNVWSGNVSVDGRVVAP